MKKKIITLFALFLFSLGLYSQMNKWAMPPKTFDVSSSPASINSLYTGAPSSGSYFVSNGVYDLNGNLRFYVVDDYVFDATGSTISQLGTHSNGGNSYNRWGGEIVIVPMPGECDKYYVFYNRSNPNMTGTAVVYIIVDCSSTTPSIISNSGSAFVVENLTYNGAGIAVSKKTGSGASSTYELYYVYQPSVGTSEIKHCVISSSGISSPSSIGYTGSIGCLPTELELSENGLWLAFNDALTGKVAVLNLSNASTYAASSELVYSYTGGEVVGLELVGSGTPDLYVAGNVSGTPFFDLCNVTSSSQTALNISPYSLPNSFLEYSKSGQVCGIGDYAGNRYLIEYDVTSSVVNATQMNNVNPNSNTTSYESLAYNSISAGVYTLPDQLDGENYTNFAGNPVVTLTGMTINGTAASNTCNGVWQEVYNCNPIKLSATFIDGVSPCEANLTLTPMNVDCEPIGGPGTFSYYGSVLSAAGSGAINNLDIRDSYDEYEQSLYTYPGYYQVTLTIIDCCGRESSMTTYIRVLAQVPPSISLQIYDYNNPQNYFSYSHSIGSPNNVGASSIGFRVSGSTGNVSLMNVIVDEVNSSGTYIGNILNETKAVPNLSGLTYENLNGYCVPSSVWGGSPPTTACSVANPSSYSGYKSYFSYNGPTLVGKYYKLTVTLSNPCSSSSEWTYLYIDDAYSRTVLTNLGEETNKFVNFVTVFPVPANDQVKIKINNLKADNFDINFYDYSGKLVKIVASNIILSEGEHNINVDLSALDSGIYFWKVSSSSFQADGKIDIVK
ncbi:MAG: T9SS type A sorting domain-containing protein [Bacteroidia bacterium]|jgi:hypothetical protein|nr:T9SS type A sorting domain-containing protein [Bacteroidia bacterium]